MSRFQTISVKRWRGLNEDESPVSLEPGQLSKAENCYLRGRAMGTRPGIEFEGSGYSQQLSDGAVAVQGLYEYRWALDANRFLVAIANGKFWKAYGTTVALDGAVTLSAGQDNRWRFATHKDVLYAAGGANSDSVLRWDGSGNVTKVTFNNSSGTPIDAKYIFSKWNYGFLAGMDGTTLDDNPMVVRHSALNNMEVWPAGNTFGGTSSVGGFSAYGDEFITGFAEFTANTVDRLLVLSNRFIYAIVQTTDAFAPFQIESVVQNGCVAQDAYVSLGVDAGEAIYLSRKGIHSLRQSQQFGERADKFLSWPIRTTFASLNQGRMKYASGAYWPKEGICLLLLSTGSNNYQDIILCLDLKDKDDLNSETAVWSIWRLNLPSSARANVLVPAREDDSSGGKSYVYIGTTKGQVCRFSTSVFQDLTASGSYSTSFRTRHNDFDLIGTTKGVGDVFVEVQPGGSYRPTFRTYFDFGRVSGEPHDLVMDASGSLWGSSLYGSSIYSQGTITSKVRIYETGEGETIAHEFSHSGANQPFWIPAMSVQVRTFGEEIGDSAE